jgi:two-component system OmpR family response regulator
MPTTVARILLIEDEPILRDSMVSALSDADFTVEAHADGHQLTQRLAAFRPDAAVLDVMLPGPSGLLLAQQVRTHSQAAIVFVTARDALADRLSGFDVGADDYLVKPFVLAELIARLKAVLRRSGRLVSGSVAVADLLIDEDAGQVLRDGQPVAITATELRVLLYLAHNRNRVLSKAQILTQVWGYDEYDPNLVETYVSVLRRKLGAPALIHTVRGVGYRMGTS